MSKDRELLWKNVENGMSNCRILGGYSHNLSIENVKFTSYISCAFVLALEIFCIKILRLSFVVVCGFFLCSVHGIFNGSKQIDLYGSFMLVCRL